MIKLLATVYYHFLWHGEATYDVLLEKLLQVPGSDVSKGFGLHPFVEVFHCHCCKLVVAWGCR